MFKVIKTEGRARRGEFQCAHGGVVQTPVFMNVGTQAAIKGGVSAFDLQELGCQIELSNTYHLHLRPGDDVVRELGGLHRFMRWDGPILTDSGGFQVFSLAGLRMGWIATHDEAALCAFLSHRDYNLISCGMFDDAVASIALRHSDAMLRRSQTIVRENLAILDAWVAAHEHFYYTKPKAGTTALVYYDFDVPSYDFCKRMYRETGAFVTPGDCFEQPHSMRIGYACDKQTLTEGLAALAAFGEMLG